jgi:agmatine/peptidylarginine deiminase
MTNTIDITHPPAGPVRLPAEWERQEAVMLSWPHENTDWAYMLDEVTQCYINLAQAIARYAHLVIVTPEPEKVISLLTGIDMNRVSIFEVATNDTWIRDFGPITTLTPNNHPIINDFKFNGWGLKFASDKDNLVTSKLLKQGHLKGDYANRLGFALEGGSIESDGKGTILTTSECILSPNRNGNLDWAHIEQYLKQTLGANHVVCLDHGNLSGDDTDGHIDTLARLAPHDTIIYVGCQDENHPDYAGLQAMKQQLTEIRTVDGKPFTLIELPLPDAIYDPDEGILLPATYANYLTINNAVLLPIYGQAQKDLLACQIMQIAYPDYDIVPVNCRALIRQHGSLHCATMQLPHNVLSI